VFFIVWWPCGAWGVWARVWACRGVWPFVDKIGLFVDYICIFADKFVPLYYKRLNVSPFKKLGLCIQISISVTGAMLKIVVGLVMPLAVGQKGFTPVLIAVVGSSFACRSLSLLCLPVFPMVSSLIVSIVFIVNLRQGVSRPDA
jgi:hypothetical protein